MKKLYCLAFIFIVLVSSCSKSGNSSSGDGYAVTGLSDITVRQYMDTIVKATYHVAVPAGIYEPVTINITGLPPGVTATPNSTSDTTSFSVLITYNILMVTVASYPVTVTLFSAYFGTKSFQFNVIVAPGAAFTYVIDSIRNVSVPLYADTIVYVPVTAVYDSGVKENITIAADGLPADVTVTPATITGTPTFTDSFAFHIKANSTGSFPVTLHTTSSQGTKVSAFNINVTAGADCSQPLAGNYSCYTTCTSYSGAGTGTSSAQVYPDGTDKLLIHFPLANMITDLNCSNGTFNTEPITSGAYTIPVGTGNFNATAIIINYTLAGTINSNCITTLTR